MTSTVNTASVNNLQTNLYVHICPYMAIGLLESVIDWALN